jgi:hypothetical protein
MILKLLESLLGSENLLFETYGADARPAAGTVVLDFVHPAQGPRRGFTAGSGCTLQSEKACVKISACPAGQQPFRLPSDGIGFCEGTT